MSTYRQQLEDICKPEYRGIRLRRETNAGLWLDKYIEKQNRGEAGAYANHVAEVATIPTPEVYRQFYKRWEQTLASSGVTSQQKRWATAKGRMIIGLGDESVLETAITLHHTYGVPYIPGSALKGLAASYARQRLGPEWQPNAKEAYQVIFGDGDEAGYITFFDALYVPDTGHKKQAMYPDIITVHHPKYYQGNTAPSDRDSPTPIPLLSATGSYLIALAAPDLQEHKMSWITKTFEILAYALEEMGIGAKTSSGYGRMMLTDKPPRSDADWRPGNVKR